MGEKQLSCFEKVKPYLLMVFLQFGYAGMYIVTMVSFKHGMSHYILAVYRHVVATIVIAPFALLLERTNFIISDFDLLTTSLRFNHIRPVLDQNLYYVGMKYTSATFTAAAVNILPAITFIMALIFRLESVNLRKIRSVAKVVGTVITVTGAMVMTLFKGPILRFLTPSLPSAAHSSHGSSSADDDGHPADQHWIAGTLMLIGSCCGWSAFFILQSFTLKKYPAELSLTALICLLGTVEGSAVSLVMERDMSAWKIGFDSRLLAAAYSGIVCSGIAYYVQGVVIKERGPVFVTAFSPLCMIITAALGSVVLAEDIRLGSVIGAVIIVVGLYTVVWGKSKDVKNLTGDEAEAAADGNGWKVSDGQELPVVAATATTTARH
ncbi:unnamed protein product [Linum tenue]|uniref:WAT1-related protein n=1 Tax=Linum tenue TaxID=586396 RepID=A0AAV0ID71_9ROSI|nr:unnamed protein product [Linum tenue]